MSNIKILDCTLRDGGYITNWYFGRSNIERIIYDLNAANLDYVEVGYLNKDVVDPDKSIFQNIEDVSCLISGLNQKSKFLAMADVDQFLPQNITPYRNGYIEGIRVVFYKHQVKRALNLCRTIKENGYKLFVQPMVTIDYTVGEFSVLADEISFLQPYAVSIVDSFGYMNKYELRKYYEILDSKFDDSVSIGFHSHNNMQLSVLNADFLFSCDDKREIIIDSSLYGMGRGAGNLSTELITNYYNENINYKYNIELIINLIGDVIYPIFQKKSWGYSPYFFITALYHCHPNYVTYLLEEKNVSLNEFEKFIRTVPNEWRTRCRKSNVLALYEKYKGGRDIKND